MPESRHYARFRLYATSLEAVAPLADHLARLGVETVTRAAFGARATTGNTF